jgi:ribosome maturation factor RimP
MGALEEIRDLADAVTRRRDLRLWDVEMGGQPGRSILRIYIDGKDGSVDLDTVAEVSEELSRALDLRDPIPGRYTLEVSSPGLERSLRQPEHFALSVGKNVTVKTKDPMHGNSHRIDGKVVDANDSTVRLAVQDEDEAEVAVPYDAIKSARTVFEW